MKKDRGFEVCRKCGKPIAIITWGVYRKAVVDAEAVVVKADPDGDEYVRIDGSKIKGIELPFLPESAGEPAYRMHRKTCGV